LNVFSASVPNACVHPQRLAVWVGWEAYAATEICVARPAFGINIEDVFLTVAYPILALTSIKHALAACPVIKLPGKRFSQLFSASAE